ncbi:MAG: hypothetical protein PSY14_00145 [bacterium]|nr:hypothetical protein [bacterium]
MKGKRVLMDPIRVQTSQEQLGSISSAIYTYKKKHGHLPGDINKDGIIGAKDFAGRFLPASSANLNDETVLFWRDLESEEGWKSPSDGNIPYPEARLKQTYFIVGYIDDTISPPFLSHPMKGNAIIWVSEAALDGGEKHQLKSFPLTSRMARYTDRKMDDGNPITGYIRAYGDCVEWYEQQNSSSSDEPQDGAYNCGIVYKIFD